MKKITFIATAILVLEACTPKTAEVVVVEEVKTETVPTAGPENRSDLAEGSKLYAEHCGKCHNLKNVTDYNEAQWRKIVPDMAEKAKIDATAENKILQFVLYKTNNK